jgi:hypothetical protein
MSSPGPRRGDSGPLEAFVEIRCLCGKMHTHRRDATLEGLCVARWKCGDCMRRYVIACTPGTGSSPEQFWPLFLENVPSTGSTQQEGSSSEDELSRESPAELHFKCRCGCRLIGKSHLYGHPTKCPKCSSQLVVRVGYESDRGRPVALLEYPESGSDS